MKRAIRKIVAVLIVLGALALVAWMLLPQPIEVDVVTIERGRLEVTVDEEGKTRVRDRFEISAPLSGQLQRIELDAGDAVVAGQQLAEIRPPAADLLDPRTWRQAHVQVRAAEARLAQAESAMHQAEAELAFAHRDLRRVERLRREDAATADELERAELLAQVRQQQYAAARWGVEVAEHELESARAVLGMYEEDDIEDGVPRRVVIRAPMDGRILRVQQESAAFVSSGALLLELGDPRVLEIVAEILSVEAVNIEPGSRVRIEQWGGEDALEGRVRLVEPFAFTDISALGVEEQRVNVIIDFLDQDGGGSHGRERLGDGYRVDVRIVTWEDDDVLIVPTGALFRHERRWAVFRIEEGRAVVRHVEIGRQSPLRAQVIAGLEEGDEVVQYPGDRIEDGVRVEPRRR